MSDDWSIAAQAFDCQCIQNSVSAGYLAGDFDSGDSNLSDRSGWLACAASWTLIRH